MGHFVTRAKLSGSKYPADSLARRTIRPGEILSDRTLWLGGQNGSYRPNGAGSRFGEGVPSGLLQQRWDIAWYSLQPSHLFGKFDSEQERYYLLYLHAVSTSVLFAKKKNNVENTFKDHHIPMFLITASDQEK